MKKTISVILLLTMLATLFTGCSLFGDNITGTWEAELDLTSYLTDSIKSAVGEENGGIMQNFALKDLKIKLISVFNEDGSYEISADKASVDAMISSTIDQIVLCVKEALKPQATELGITEEALDELISNSRTELEASLTEDAVSGLMEKYAKKGFYKAESGKLYTADSVEALETAGYETYELADDTLTINKGEGLEDTYSETIGTIYPIVYKRKAE